MGYLVLAYIMALIHFGFVVFVIAGGLLAYRWPYVLWLHLPIAVYGIMIMVVHWRCPLTDAEIWFRKMAGETVEWTGFLEHYFLSYLGLDGTEWFVLVALIFLILLCNTKPYWKFFTGL